MADVTLPTDLPQPQYPGSGLFVPPDLPHVPMVVDQSWQGNVVNGAQPLTIPSNYGNSVGDWAPVQGVDISGVKLPSDLPAPPTSDSNFYKEFAPEPRKPVNPMAVDTGAQLRSALDLAARHQRFQTGQATPGDYAAQAAQAAAALGTAGVMMPIELGASVLQAPEMAKQAITEAGAYKPGTSEPPVALPTQTAMALAGARIAGAPEEGMTLGAGPSGEPPLKPPADLPTPQQLAEQRITDAYFKNTGGQANQPVFLSDIRADAGLPREQADAALTSLHSTGKGGAQLGTWDNPRDINPERQDAALNFKGETKHTLTMTEPRAVEGEIIPPEKGVALTPAEEQMRFRQMAQNVPREGVSSAPVTPMTPEEHIASVTGREPPTVVTDKQVPYLAGSSNDGSTVYIDPRVPDKLTIKAASGTGNVTIDPAHPLAVHEGVEHAAMQDGAPYEVGHRKALVEEQKVVQQLGGDWNDYQSKMHRLAEQTEKEPIQQKDLPSDLYAKPYAHTDLYKKVEGAETSPAASPLVSESIAAGKPGGEAGVGPQPPGGGKPPPGPSAAAAGPSPPRGAPLPDTPPTASIRRMENDLFAINARDNVRRRLDFEQLGKLKGDEATDTSVYHKREAGQQNTFTPTEAQLNRDWIEPLRRQTDAMKTELSQIMGKDYAEGPINDPNYMHRMRIGSTPEMDRAAGIGETIGYAGGRMSRTPPSSRGRSIFAMEDENGNRKVVTAYPGGDGVYSWKGGKAAREVGSFIRTKPSQFKEGEEIPGRTTLERPVPARVTKEGGLSQAYTKEPRQIPDRLTLDRNTEPQLVNDVFRPGSEFVDMNNKRWLMKQATTKEIHDAGVKSGPLVRYTDSQGNTRLQAGPPVRFYESALGSELNDYHQVARALDTAKTMEKIQNSPEFKRYSVDAKDATPEQRREMVQIGWPGWEGRYYDPKFAEPILDHIQGQGVNLGWFDRLNNFSTGTLFKTGIGSIAHGINEHMQRFVSRGITGNLNVPRRISTFYQALDETQNRGPIWQDYRNRGAAFPSDRPSMQPRSMGEQLFRALGKKAETDPGIVARAKRLGMAPVEYVNALSEALGRAAFKYGDFIALQRGLELERQGYTRDQAIDKLNQTLPTYRLPSRVGLRGQAGRVVSQALGARSAIQFGRFEYSKFKALSSIVEDMLGGSHIQGLSNASQRWDAINRAALIAVTLGLFAPMIANPLLRKITGNPNARFTFGGSLGLLSRMIRSVDDALSGHKNLIDVAMDALNLTNIAPVTKELVSQFPFNEDAYTHQPIRGKGVGTGTAIAESATHALPSLVQPLQAFKDPLRYLEEAGHVSTSKPYVPIITKRTQFQNARIPGANVVPTVKHYLGMD